MRGLVLDPFTGKPEGSGTIEQASRRPAELEHALAVARTCEMIRRAAEHPDLVATLPNSTATTAQGETIGTHDPTGSAPETEVVMLAHASGHLFDTLPTYYYWRTFTAGAQNQRTVDIFNASGSGVTVKLKKLFVMHDQSTVVGVAHRFDVIRTSAVGTGGTTITSQKAATANAAVPAQVTARLSATGGATEGATQFSIATNPEETLAPAAIHPGLNWIPDGPAIQEPELAEGEGILLKQITNSTVGVWGVLLVASIY